MTIKHIMVQLPEPCNPKSEAYKAGYKNICEIGKERIRRAGKKILEEHPELRGDLDVGFRVFKVDEPNVTETYYRPAEWDKTLLHALEDPVRPDRSDLDLFFGCVLDIGLPINLAYTRRRVCREHVYIYADGDMIGCFAREISPRLLIRLFELKPHCLVIRESSLSAGLMMYVDRYKEDISPHTEVRLL